MTEKLRWTSMIISAISSSQSKVFVVRFSLREIDFFPLKYAILSFGKCTGKNGFVTATELGTTNKIFVAATKNFPAATKRFADRTKHFVVVTKYFCYPYFNK